MPFLSQVKEKFTLYQLKEISEFKSIYSLRLYELIQEFEDTGYIIISIKKLRSCFALKDKLNKYNDLKRKTFGHAVKEINKHYHIDLDFQEIKEGRKVAAIKFTFNKTKIAKRYRQDGSYTNEYIKPKEKSK
jgi:plasmid replication initiation protein